MPPRVIVFLITGHRKDPTEPTREKPDSQRYRWGAKLKRYPGGFYSHGCEGMGRGGKERRGRRRGERREVFIVVEWANTFTTLAY